MTRLRDLQEEILYGPRSAECAPFVNDGSDPARKASAPADDAAIAEILSEGRTRIVSREIGDGAVAIALGIPGGPVFLYQLEMAAETSPGASATDEQVAQHAIARQAWRSLQKASLDIGNAVVRAGIDSMVGTLLTADQAAAVKELAEVPDIVSVADVSLAMRGPWGDE